jgi:dynein heavy chain
MRNACDITNVVEACNMDGRQERLENMLAQLEQCEKALQVRGSNLFCCCQTISLSYYCRNLSAVPVYKADCVLRATQLIALHTRCVLSALQDYLETKRIAFPRFYFVAPADLLDILSKGSNPQLILRHLSKCFDNVHNLSFRKDDRGEPTKVGMHRKAARMLPLHA